MLRKTVTSLRLSGGEVKLAVVGWRCEVALLVAILMVAALLRGYDLGRTSLWYDEVVSARLARQPGPAALLRLLPEIDATRAPLHPLLLQGWMGLFGPSDLSARAFSAVCGLLTVATAYVIGRAASGRSVGLWASWLCAVSPALIRYSREVRMYAWLTLLTCLAWALLLSFRQSAPAWKRALYVAALVGLFYTHPLGAFMVAALGLASLSHRRAFQLSWGSWLSIQAAVALAAAPWVGQYTGHSPEYLLPRYPIRFLIGMPIEFVGGNSRVLLACFALVAVGLLQARRSTGGDWVRFAVDGPVASTTLLVWFLLPPILLYAYSWIWHPIFGLARYTLFVAPAYLVLLARGLAKLPMWPRIAAAAVGAMLAAAMLSSTVYAPDLRADWRAAAAFLQSQSLESPVVVPWRDDGLINGEAIGARNYLAADAVVIGSPTELGRFLLSPRRGDDIWVGIGMDPGTGLPAVEVPKALASGYREVEVRSFEGLRLVRLSPL